jgi:hypothetical protein
VHFRVEVNIVVEIKSTIQQLEGYSRVKMDAVARVPVRFPTSGLNLASLI